MVFDLNSQPPGLGEAFTNRTEDPLYEVPFPIHGALPDLNEEPLDEEQLFQFHEAHEAQLVGSEYKNHEYMKHNSSGKFFQDLISIIIMSTRIKLARYICAYLTAVHAEDEHHQSNPDGWARLDLNALPTGDEQEPVGKAIPDLNVQPTYDEHQLDGEAIPDLNVQPADIEQQADGDIAFDVPAEQYDFDLDLLIPSQHEEMQQSTISNLH